MSGFGIQVFPGTMADYLENCRRLNRHERDRWADELAALTCEHGRNPVESGGQWRRWTPCGECIPAPEVA